MFDGSPFGGQGVFRWYRHIFDVVGMGCEDVGVEFLCGIVVCLVGEFTSLLREGWCIRRDRKECLRVLGVDLEVEGFG